MASNTFASATTLQTATPNTSCNDSSNTQHHHQHQTTKSLYSRYVKYLCPAYRRACAERRPNPQSVSEAPVSKELPLFFLLSRQTNTNKRQGVEWNGTRETKIARTPENCPQNRRQLIHLRAVVREKETSGENTQLMKKKNMFATWWVFVQKRQKKKQHNTLPKNKLDKET